MHFRYGWYDIQRITTPNWVAVEDGSCYEADPAKFLIYRNLQAHTKKDESRRLRLLYIFYSTSTGIWFLAVLDYIHLIPGVPGTR